MRKMKLLIPALALCLLLAGCGSSSGSTEVKDLYGFMMIDLKK